MSDTFKPGELFVYTNGDRWELGKVKRLREDGKYACWYSTGDTAAVTPPENMHKLENAGYSRAECVTLGWVLDHMALMSRVAIQDEESELDGDTIYEGPGMHCPDELRGRIVENLEPESYLDMRYFWIKVR